MENLNNLTKEENYYYNILEDMLFNGDIDESERNILNKRKEEFKISDSRAKELEDFAKLNNSNSRAKELKELEDLIKLNNGGSSYKNNKNSENKEENNEVLGITSSISERKAPHFKTEGEKNYYELLVDMLEDGIIDESERNILNKRKNKYQISEARAKELEDIIKDIIKFDNSGSSYNENNKDSENNEVLEVKKTANGFTPKNYNTAENKNTVDLLEKGKVYYFNKEYNKAIECYKKAVKLEPNNSVNWYWLGVSYHKNKQFDEAEECYRKALEINPDNEDAKNSLENLQSHTSSGVKTVENIFMNFFKR